ncbi:MAG: RdgB/HAM1 family non-canonical purine NTP pyrophosphatase [Alphaproteobacteria bacterium]|nr:RdgB/HAM1 family non-canonical purine NTP pyrophosphatase [Alphaproteobacteria bacterium]
MTRKFTDNALVIATHNAGKVGEIAALLGPYVASFESAGALGLAEPEETGETFQDNAKIKALAAVLASGKPALADDSGLCVHALGGEPGVYSARWAGPDKDFSLAMRRIETLLGPSPDRSASFVCALALAWPDGHVEVFEGRVSGEMVFPPRGERGFGYDPVFVPEGYDISFAEMDPAEKHRISHRAAAFSMLVESCFT